MSWTRESQRNHRRPARAPSCTRRRRGRRRRDHRARAGGRSADDDCRACVGSHGVRSGAVLGPTRDRGGTEGEARTRSWSDLGWKTDADAHAPRERTRRRPRLTPCSPPGPLPSNHAPRSTPITPELRHKEGSCYTLIIIIHREIAEPYTSSPPLRAEAVERAPGALQRVHNVERRHRFPLRVLRVRDAVADDLSTEAPMSVHRHPRSTQGRLTFSRKILSTPRVSS